MIYIETDASINPGGGPLVDVNGRVAGLNTMIHSPSGDEQSALPCRATSCGCRCLRMGWPTGRKTTENARRLGVNLCPHPVGYNVMFEVLRGSEQLTMEVPVVVQEADPQRFAELEDPEKNLIPKRGILGVEIDRRLAAMGRRRYGVVVAARAAGCDASEIDLRPGDVIYSVNKGPTATIGALRTALAQSKPRDSAVLQLERAVLAFERRDLQKPSRRCPIFSFLVLR